MALCGATALEFACGLAHWADLSASSSRRRRHSGSSCRTAAGLSSPSVLNPTLEAQDTAIGPHRQLFALLLALGAGVHRVALADLLTSFRDLPVATVTLSAGEPCSRFVDLAVTSFVVGVDSRSPASRCGAGRADRSRDDRARRPVAPDLQRGLRRPAHRRASSSSSAACTTWRPVCSRTTRRCPAGSTSFSADSRGLGR